MPLPLAERSSDLLIFSDSSIVLIKNMNMKHFVFIQKVRPRNQADSYLFNEENIGITIFLYLYVLT